MFVYEALTRPAFSRKVFATTFSGSKFMERSKWDWASRRRLGLKDIAAPVSRGIRWNKEFTQLTKLTA